MKLSKLLTRYPLLLLFVVGFFVHAYKIGMDLPNNYNTDEPHHLNVAAHFGTGDLNPHDFKYPSLWKYALFAMLGAIYVAGLLMSLVATSAQFAQQYLYHPGFFFLCARLLSAAFLCLVPLVFYVIGTRFYNQKIAWSAACLALLSSALSNFGIQAVPYSLLVFCAACALVPLHEIMSGAGLKSYLLMGLFIGLSISSHYVAAPFVSLLAVAFFQPISLRTKIQYMLAGFAMVLVGFFLGTPYLLIDLKGAMPTFTEHYEIEDVGIFSNVSREKFAAMALNFFQFLDTWGVGFVLMVVGAFAAIRKNKKMAVLFFPLVSAWPILLISFYGNVIRYTVLLSLPLILLASFGVVYVLETFGQSVVKRSVIILAFVAVLASDYCLNRYYLALPDCRTQAKEWIQKNVPSGEKLFLPGFYYGPQLLMDKTQTDRLAQRMRELNHPRAIYFETLSAGHPGGGYELFYIKKTIEEMRDLPGRTQRAFEAQELLDVASDGTRVLHANGIRWVVVLKKWYVQDRYKSWLQQLRTEARLVATFDAVPKRIKGESVDIYEFEAAAPRS